MSTLTQCEAPTLVLARLGEVFLKGQNQKWFLNKLRSNLKANLQYAIGPCTLSSARGQIFIHLDSPEQLQDALEVCVRTPGLTSCSPVYRVEPVADQIRDAAVEIAREKWSGQTLRFAVNAKRADKTHPVTSPKMNELIAQPILAEHTFTVDLKNPEAILSVTYGRKHAHIWTESRPCVGGIPIGAAGDVMLLLSGGIDSPVAGYLAQKRGCRLSAVYFHSPPFVSEASRLKVEKLGQNLAARQNGMRLHVVTFTQVQKAIREVCEPRLTVLLYRRFMYRIAAEVAKKAGCYALCTGENLSQVASQTLENLHMVDAVTDRMTLRPLISYDKGEIVKLARQIDTLETSIQPFDDCCTLFVPKHPETRGRLPILLAAEAKLDVERLVKQAVDSVETVRLSPTPSG